MRILMSLLAFILIAALLSCSSAPQKEVSSEPDPKQKALKELLRYTKNNIDAIEAEKGVCASMIESNIRLADTAKKLYKEKELEEQLTIYAKQIEMHQTRIEELERRIKKLKQLINILE